MREQIDYEGREKYTVSEWRHSVVANGAVPANLGEVIQVSAGAIFSLITLKMETVRISETLEILFTLHRAITHGQNAL
jgi:hypothetical protein